MGAEEAKVSFIQQIHETQLTLNVKFIYFYMRITHHIF